MSTLVESLPSVGYADGIVRVEFPGGASLQFPVRGNRRLAEIGRASCRERV